MILPPTLSVALSIALLSNVICDSASQFLSRIDALVLTRSKWSFKVGGISCLPDRVSYKRAITFTLQNDVAFCTNNKLSGKPLTTLATDALTLCLYLSPLYKMLHNIKKYFWCIAMPSNTNQTQYFESAKCHSGCFCLTTEVCGSNQTITIL